MTSAMQIGTFSYAFGTVFSVLAMNAYSANAGELVTPLKKISNVNVVSTNSTYASVFSGQYPVMERSFEEQFAEAYLNFASKQKRIDQDFADLLAANMWDLYAR